MNYKVALRLGDAYGKEKIGYLASSRIRGHWLARYWPECDDFFYPREFNQTSEQFFNPVNQMCILANYDAVIFNKTYEWRLARLLRKNKQIVIADICDPDYLSSHSSKQRVRDCRKMLKYANCVVVNGEEMKKTVRKFYKGIIKVIPDRIDIRSCVPKKETHNEELKRIVWYGYSENLRILEPYLKQIINMGIEITIISDKFFENLILTGCKYKPKDMITFKVWHPESINEQIISHDAVFIARDQDPYLSKFKSNNRCMTAYALKMPVAWDIEDLELLQPKINRELDAKEGYLLCRRHFDVRHSVYSYDKLIKSLIGRKK